MERELAVVDEKRELVKRTVAKDATNDELELYFYDCTRQGVHPLDKLIHFTKRNGKYTPITSIDFMRMRASSTKEYAGSDPVVFTGDRDDDPKETLAASVTVYRFVQGVRCPWTATARWKEYYPGDVQGWAWKKMPHVMLEKCAEALALRKAFPAELHGLYAKEEMDQAGDTTSEKSARPKTLAAALTPAPAPIVQVIDTGPPVGAADTRPPEPTRDAESGTGTALSPPAEPPVPTSPDILVWDGCFTGIDQPKGKGPYKLRCFDSQEERVFDAWEMPSCLKDMTAEQLKYLVGQPCRVDYRMKSNIYKGKTYQNATLEHLEILP